MGAPLEKASRPPLQRVFFSLSGAQLSDQDVESFGGKEDCPQLDNPVQGYVTLLNGSCSRDRAPFERSPFALPCGNTFRLRFEAPCATDVGLS